MECETQDAFDVGEVVGGVVAGHVGFDVATGERDEIFVAGWLYACDMGMG